jgi:hypothetical protein
MIEFAALSTVFFAALLSACHLWFLRRLPELPAQYRARCPKSW